MKNIRLIILSTLLTLGIFSTIVITSCKKTKNCEGISCKNGGTCSDGTCSCPPGYEGTLCETKSVEDFTGQYTGNDTCVGFQHQVIIGQTSTTTFTIQGLGGFQLSGMGTLTATGSHNILTIPTKTVSGTTVSGTGTLSGNTISIVYVASDITGSYTCNFTGTK